MFKPLVEEQEKVKSRTAAFEESVNGSEIVVIRQDVYLRGTYGYFLVGQLVGEDQVDVGHDKSVEKYDKLIRDKILAAGYGIVQKVVADWLPEPRREEEKKRYPQTAFDKKAIA